MKFAARSLFLLFFAGTVLAQVQPAFPPQITHVVVIFQENRTPDNLFQGLPNKCPLPPPPAITCTPTVGTGCYDVSPCGLSKQTGTDVAATLTAKALAGGYDPNHSHNSFELMCNPNPGNLLSCQMDGAWQIPDSCDSDPTCTNKGQGQQLSYKFVDNTAQTYNNAYGMGNTSVVGPYLAFAQQYGWANFMYQTNQGPSYPAHQFIFSGTSAPTATDDLHATFVAENFTPSTSPAGCLASLNASNSLISPNLTSTCPSNCTCYDNNTVKECKLVNNPLGTFCFSHDTMATLLDAATPPVTWKYYAPSAGSIWTAPDSFLSICQPNSAFTQCTGPEWTADVDLHDTDILRDINNCNLSNVSWVIPDGRWSDHAGGNDGTGPSWVAAIINEIGGFDNTCGYWNNTAIVVTWDDWGGWSDNQPAAVINPVGGQGDYQYGFRVPMLVVSGYTRAGMINNTNHDFGSILRMIEGIFGITEGKLGFADARATTDLHAFFPLTTARSYTIVPAVKDPNYFLGFTGTPTAPDGDDEP